MIWLGKVDTAIERVEEVTEVVEEVAEAIEDLSEMVENKLPEDSVIKKEVDIVKNLSGNAVKEAKKAEELLDQVWNPSTPITSNFLDQVFYIILSILSGIWI